MFLKNNRIIHQVWIGGPMPQKVMDLVQTIDDNNSIAMGWEHRIWTEKEFLSYGINIHQFDSNTKLAGISNGLRLRIIERFGGIYLDCDFECVRPLDSLLQYEAFAAPQDHRLCNAAFGAVPHHPWIKWQIENVEQYNGFDPTWGVLLMDKAPREGVTVLPKDTFYPWLWHVPEHERQATENTLAIHHWHGSWA